MKKVHIYPAFISVIIFIIIVSYLILEPEIHENGFHNEIRWSQDYVDPDAEDLEQPLFKSVNFSDIVQAYYEKYRVDLNYETVIPAWRLAASWVKAREIHPEHAPQIGHIQHMMVTSKIIKADIGHKGTQLKLSLILEGGQRVVFKPKWYSKDFVILGQPYDGADRHNGEIAAFHLNRILGFRKTPIVVGRRINLRTEIIPVAEKRLLETFFNRDNNTCFYGVCHYCKGENDGVCAKGELLEGTLVLWLPETFILQNHPHPWRRTYQDGKLARWEKDHDYCQHVRQTPPYNHGPRLLDLIDGAIFDYLIGNADRHHYETFKDINNSMVLLLDNGKSFGNPLYDEHSILAPLMQCCLVRDSTYERLLELQWDVLSQVMEKLLQSDPLAPLLFDLHLKAMDRRLVRVLRIIKECLLVSHHIEGHHDVLVTAEM